MTMETRRKRPDSEDRRGIPRFTDNEFNSLLTTETKLLKVFGAIFLAFAIFEMGYSLKDGLEWGTRGIFFVVIFVIMAVFIFHRFKMVRHYLENNSISNLRRCQESLNTFLTYASVILGIFFIVSVLYRL